MPLCTIAIAVAIAIVYNVANCVKTRQWAIQCITFADKLRFSKPVSQLTTDGLLEIFQLTITEVLDVLLTIRSCLVLLLIQKLSFHSLLDIRYYNTVTVYVFIVFIK